jgi:hypothetical protein
LPTYQRQRSADAHADGDGAQLPVATGPCSQVSRFDGESTDFAVASSNQLGGSGTGDVAPDGAVSGSSSSFSRFRGETRPASLVAHSPEPDSFPLSDGGSEQGTDVLDMLLADNSD